MEEIKFMKLVARALDHKLRGRIIDYILSQGTTTVQPIYVKLRIEQSVCSQHLKILSRVGILEFEKEGKNIRYWVNKPLLEHYRGTAKKIMV